MGEVEKQGFICKICSKSCVSGKSLGGHMRVHLALIAANKKAAKAKFVSKMCDDDDDGDDDDDDQDGSYQLGKSSKNQPKSTRLNQEKINNSNTNSEYEDADPNNSYELRENPKKSRRFSDSKQGITEYGVTCKECGKEFSTLRALSGHMRCHSMKNKVGHQCKECGKAFDSIRAMFGHMKSHSKKSRVSNDSVDSVSELESLCPVRKKRSCIRYKIALNPSFSSLNEATSADSEIMEVKLAAKCLMMISKGVTRWAGFNSVIESDDNDDSPYFGAESSGKRKRVDGNNDDLICDGDKVLKMDLTNNGNVLEFGDLVAKNKKKVDVEFSDNWLLKVENVMKDGVGVSDHGLRRMDKLKELDQFECLNNQLRQESAGISSEFTESLMEETMAVNRESEGIHDLFDLNFPKNVEGKKGNVGSNRWWGESGRKHDLLVMTN